MTDAIKAPQRESRWLHWLTNRYLFLLCETCLVAVWAALVFRQRSSDEVVAVTLVVVICLMFWGELLNRLIPRMTNWFSGYITRTFGPTKPIELPVRPALKASGWSVVIALISFVVAEVYASGLLISATVLSAGSLAWASGEALSAGVVLGVAGVALLLLATTVVIAAIVLSVFSFTDLSTRIVRNTLDLLVVIMPPLFGESDAPRKRKFSHA
jgi:hypothetical protein